MDSKPPPDAAPATDATVVDAPRRRLPRKWLIVGGAGIGTLLIGALALVLLWPSAPEAPLAKARPAKTKANAKAAEPVASAPAQALASASAPAHDEVPPVAAAPASAAASAAVAQVAEPAATAAEPAAEDPMDRLRRRLGQALARNGTLDESASGELRVRTHAVAVAHVASKPGAPATARRASAAHWSYEGAGGPQAWGTLKPEFSACAKGTRQSPIDIQGGLALDLDAPVFDYRPGAFSVIDNGHTVQVNVAAGNALEVMGRRYELQQFHFHRPSEERIDGRRHEMSVHLVHKDADGRLAVVAVLLERGAAQPLLQSVWNNLPLEKGEALAARAPLDPGQLLPADRRYYTYMGSLTVPPCSEGVLWLVMQQPVPVSAQQIDIFARLYPMNARPVQALAGRLIKQSN
jgi:carbonic anhydrase